MLAIIGLLVITVIFLAFVQGDYHLSKVFRVLKVLTVISFLLPVLAVVWLSFVSSDPTISAPEYIPDIFGVMLVSSVGCIGGLAFVWLVGYIYWLYAKRANQFEISSWHLVLMLIAAVAGWFTVTYLATMTLLRL